MALELSIIIPTFNRQGSLARVLAALEVQTFPLDDIEVIVVSDGATDATNHFLQQYRAPFAFRPVFQANQGVATARNTGVEHARAGRILFLDDDVCPAPQLVAEHIAWLKGNEKVVVLGPMLTPPDVRLLPWVAWEQSMLEKQYQYIQSGTWEATARQFYTGNTSLEKVYIEQAGGFDTTFLRSEDVELAYRLRDMNLRFLFNFRAIGYHYAERSFQTWMDVAYTYGQNNVRMARQKKQDWLLPEIWEQYRIRSIFIRGLVRLCLDRPGLQAWAINSMKTMALVADRQKQPRMARYLFSGIYNLRYFQGVADGLGGRRAFYGDLPVKKIPASQEEPGNGSARAEI